MTTILKIPLKSADEGLIRELQEKYPDAVLHIEAEVRPGERPMDEDQFWAIIDLSPPTIPQSNLRAALLIPA